MISTVSRSVNIPEFAFILTGLLMSSVPLPQVLQEIYRESPRIYSRG